MKAENITQLMMCFGKRAAEMPVFITAMNLAKDKTFDGAHEYFLNPTSGFYMIFDEDGDQFKKINITLRARFGSTHSYDGELPLDIAPNWSRTEVLEHFGTPLKSKPPGRIPLLGPYGGHDEYAMPGPPAYRLVFGYTAERGLASVAMILPDA